MKHLFVPYEIALLAKEKGFNEECLSCYHEIPVSPYGWHLSGTRNTSFATHIPRQNDQSGGIDFTGYINSLDKKSNYYNGHIAAPTHQQIIDWFREIHGIHISVGTYEYSVKSQHPTISKRHEFSTYYENLNKAIEEAFKII